MEVISMGIFADKCPECGNKVKKAARFCSKCGKGAPGGWWKCHNCGKWVGNESEHCWNCNARLHPDIRHMIAGGQWQKPGNVFAQRFEIGDVKKLLNNGLQVQAGTAAILLQGGKFKDILKPGAHNLDSLASRINHWGSPPPRTAILVDNGDVVLPLRVEGLRSSEEIPVEFYGEAVFHFNHKKAESFVNNLLKDQQVLNYEDITELLLPEVRQAVETLCIASTIEDLLKDPERRMRLEDALHETLEQALDRYGLSLVRVASGDFTGEKYEELREKKGDIELKRRELEFDQSLRELLSGDRMNELKNEQDLEEYANQLAQEKDISDEHRQHELERLKQVQRHEVEREEARYQMSEEMEKTGHEIGLQTKWDEYGRGRQVSDAETHDRVERIRVQRETEETDKWLDVKSKKRKLEREDDEESRRIQREDETARAKAFEGLELPALIAAVTDSERQQNLLKLHEQLQQQKITAEQLKSMKESKEQIEREYNEKKQTSKETLDRLERLMHDTVQSMSDASKSNKGGDVHIVR